MNGIKLISGSSNQKLSQEISNHLGIPLTSVEIKRFSDQELNIHILENVRGEDVFIIQSTSYPANDNIIEVALLVDALRRASARRINLVIPYFGYARQDRKSQPRVPISAKVIARIFETSGASRVLTMDLHADQIQGFFDIPVDHLYAASILVEYFKKNNSKDCVIVSPDSGGAERARFFAKHLDASLALIDKRRNKPNESEVMHVVGNVKDKHCIIIDDMIDTAGTICKAAVALKNMGALSISAGATHAVLSGDAIKRLEDAPFDKVVLTNTISVALKDTKNSKIEFLSVAPLIGDAIMRIHNESSVSSLFI